MEKIFKDFKVNNIEIPIQPISYRGDAYCYLTYYTWKDKPDNYHDDKPTCGVAFGTIDIFSKGDFKNVEEEVKKKLLDNEFVITDIASEDYDETTGYYHVPVNFILEGGL